MIKKFKIELSILLILILNIFISYNLDIGFYNFFKSFDNSIQQIYLKKFFIQITSLGDSKWYFLISLALILILLFFRGRKTFKKYNKLIDININFFVFIFLGVLITGILTQLLKHIVGRPRPNHTNFNEDIGFNFFTFNSDFHSFPSGHTSTIFIVILIVSYFLPKTKYFLLFFAFFVAFSRVVVGAHFITDVIGGIVMAYLGLKITKYFLDNYSFINTDKSVAEINYALSGKLYILILFLFFMMVLLTFGPTIDIYIGSLFYFGNSQFLLQEYYDITVFFRKVVLRAIIIYILILPIFTLWLPLKNLYFGYVFNIKSIIFLWISGFINLILIINLLLKNFWGRARPGEIIQLGGKDAFTPWYKMSQACETNCSFVSGDASIGFSVFVLYFLTKNEVYLWLAFISGFALGLIRIMEGGHFVSDVVMSALLVVFLYYFQTKYFQKKYV